LITAEGKRVEGVEPSVIEMAPVVGGASSEGFRTRRQTATALIRW
jgi:hypothetical protein